MKAFWKTIVGDTANLCAVAALVLVTAVLARTGNAQVAAVTVPVLTLGAIAWLAVR